MRPPTISWPLVNNLEKCSRLLWDKCNSVSGGKYGALAVAEEVCKSGKMEAREHKCFTLFIYAEKKNFQS